MTFQQMEALFGAELFDRRQRSARLTEKGEEMLLVAKPWSSCPMPSPTRA